MEKMAEFIALWDLVQDVQFNEDKDQIKWKCTASGSYTSKYAYEAQFRGSFTTLEASNIWRAYTKAKHKFFAWVLIQSKILTADKMIARNWDCHTMCPLCDQENETSVHLYLKCCYAKEIWVLVSIWSGGTICMPAIDEDEMEIWWTRSLEPFSKKQRRSVTAYLIMTTWNIWKERNRRVFEGTSLRLTQVFDLIQEEVMMHQRACGTPELG